jgi:hypothetical protein
MKSDNTMLSEVQRQRVWEGMLGAEIRANYFADLSGRLHTRQRAAIWATLVLSSGAAASVIASLPADYSWVRVVLTVGTAAISAYSVVMQNQKFAVDAAELHLRWNRLMREYEQIWEDVYAEDAAARLNSLDERAAEISKTGVAFGYNKRTMLKWERHVIAHRLAHAS